MEIAFVDESGDTGRKFNEGSSPYFLLSFIFFEDLEALRNMDKAISDFKEKQGLPNDYEIKFSSCPDKIKMAFLSLIKRLNFRFSSVVINKRTNNISSRTEMYCLALHSVVKYSENVSCLEKIVIDEFFRKGDLHKVEKAILPIARMKGLRKVKIFQKDSKKDNLIQLADFIAGVINRLVNHQKDGEKYFEYIQYKSDFILMK